MRLRELEARDEATDTTGRQTWERCLEELEEQVAALHSMAVDAEARSWDAIGMSMVTRIALEKRP